MKKHVLLGSVLLAAISAFSQNQNKLKQSHTGILNTKIIANAKFADNGIPVATTIPTQSQPAVLNANAKAANVSVTWQPFTSSMNILSVIIGYCKPLQWNDELDAVSFVCRKSPYYDITPAPASNAENGSIVAMISTNCGSGWDSTAIYADDTYWGRYPGGAIYNPPGNTNINNAYIVAAGPCTGAPGGWIANYYVSKKLGGANYNSTPDDEQIMTPDGPFPPGVPSRNDFAAYGFTATDDGKVRVLTGISDGIAESDTAVMLMTGIFNGSTFDWEGRVFDPPTTVSSIDNGEQWVSRPMMAWNEQGTVGYVIIIGARIGTTGSNVGWQPIVYKTTNSGGTWSLEAGIDFNDPLFADVKRSIVAVTADSTLEVPFFNWIEGMDCIVDANDKLHIFSTVIGTHSNHPDSTGYIRSFTTQGYRWPHEPGYRPYLYDFVYDGTNTSPAWSYMLIDSMSSEGVAGVENGNGYDDNPWDPNPAVQNGKSRIDARIQLSRTPDGEHILYSWAESDTLFTNFQRKWNTFPDVKARLYDVANSELSPDELNLTSGSMDVATRAMYHFISPKFKLISKTVTSPGVTKIEVDLPTTVSNSNPYSQLTTNTHWYACATLEYHLYKTSIGEHALNSVNNSLIYPNPAHNNATVKLELQHFSNVNVSVMNTMGQVVKTTSAQGQIGTNSVNVDLNGLASGVYLVNIKVDGASSTKKLIVE